MEFLKNIGAVCRQHYEKILLTLVLFGLAVTVAFLYHATQSEAEKVQDFLKVIAKKKVAGVKPVNLARNDAVIQQAQTPPALNLSSPHYLLNPVRRHRHPDGRLFKITSDQDLIKNIQVTTIRPLNFVIAFDRVAGSGYWFNVTNEVASFPAPRRQSYFAILKLILENKTFTKQRVGAKLRSGGDEYKIVAINQNEVVLSASSNDKKYL